MLVPSAFEWPATLEDEDSRCKLDEDLKIRYKELLLSSLSQHYKREQGSEKGVQDKVHNRWIIVDFGICHTCS